MNLDFLKQFSNRRSLFLDITFYFMVSLLISTILCYFIFGIKIYLQVEKIKQIESSMATIGTEGQRAFEKTVFDYQIRIDDFAKLISEHQNFSNAFSFIERNTFPDVWFLSFGLTGKNNALRLEGEAENMNSLSRQISIFENSEYVKSIDLLNSSIGSNNKIKFSLSIIFDPVVFQFTEPEVITIP